MAINPKIIAFLKQRHILNLALANGDQAYACACFYAFDEANMSLIVASDENTTHIKMIKSNPKVALSIVLDTKIIGKIQGIQASGDMVADDSETAKNVYFGRFAFARFANPRLFCIKLDWIKFTSNALSKKIIWQREKI